MEFLDPKIDIALQKDEFQRACELASRKMWPEECVCAVGKSMINMQSAEETARLLEIAQKCLEEQAYERKKEKQTQVLKMVARGIDQDFIADVAGLSKEEIEKIIKEHS